MSSTYSISAAQAKFPALVKEAAEKTVTITRRDAFAGYLISPDRFLFQERARLVRCEFIERRSVIHEMMETLASRLKS